MKAIRIRLTVPKLREVFADVVRTAKGPNPKLTTDPTTVTGSYWVGPVAIVNLNPFEIADAGFSVDDLKGIIAHEIGHLKLRHQDLGPSHSRPQPLNWSIEFSADRFAAENGFRNELRGGLERSLERYGDLGASHSHPPLSDRIKKLQEV